MTPFNQITKQVIDFQKTSFSSIFDAMATFQDQTVNAVDTALDQTAWLPEDGRKAIRDWVDACQEERDRFKTYVDDGFSGLQKYLGSIKIAGSAKTKK
jgi:uncharacterized ferritin-like protein (DUF455 family)